MRDELSYRKIASARAFTLAWIAHFSFSSVDEEKNLCDYPCYISIVCLCRSELLRFDQFKGVIQNGLGETYPFTPDKSEAISSNRIY